MASGDRPVYYWETSMWIVYLNGGTEHPDVFERAEEIAKLIRRNQVLIVTSVITRAELLEHRLGPQKLRTYDEQFARKNVVEQPVTRAVFLRASDYRSHFPTLRKGAKFADAVHLATAVDNNVDEFHTTDAGDLLPCNGDSMLRGTQVIRPVSTKPSLFTGVSALPVAKSDDAKGSTIIEAPKEIDIPGMRTDTEVAATPANGTPESSKPQTPILESPPTVVTDTAETSATAPEITNSDHDKKA